MVALISAVVYVECNIGCCIMGLCDDILYNPVKHMVVSVKYCGGLPVCVMPHFSIPCLLSK
jgi:hypothetical protein